MKECVEAYKTAEMSRSFAVKMTAKGNLEEGGDPVTVEQELENTNDLRKAGKQQRHLDVATKMEMRG